MDTTQQLNQMTDRQIKILKAVVDEYITSGNAVGSELLEKKFKVGYSPATIRNEMVVLGKMGFIEKSHFSSGRIPTPKAFRFYINTLLPKKPLSTADEVSMKNEVWDFKNDEMRFLEETARILSEKSNMLSIVFLASGFRYYTGINHMLAIKEFLDYELSKMVFTYLDDIDYWLKVLPDLVENQDEISILLGDDYHVKQFQNLGSVFSRFTINNKNGFIGLIGPCRLEYSSAVPLVNYSARIINEVFNKDATE
ncbi:MAG: hypothetical protein NUV65_05570 [Candidatus Roizmanbacteria bacterium]|nr:hypothetical protein [Candidatus Roizmanbacteria bacterium]